MKKINNKIIVVSAVSLSAALLGAASTNTNKAYAKTVSVKPQKVGKQKRLNSSKTNLKFRTKSAKAVSAQNAQISNEKQDNSSSIGTATENSQPTETSNTDINEDKQSLVNKQEEASIKGKNNSQDSSKHNEDRLVKDASSFAHAAVVSHTMSSQEKPLGWNNVGYSLSFKVTNESNTGEVIPQGSKLRIKIEPDSRVPLANFLVYSSINQSSDIFSLVDDRNGTFEITINKDLVPGDYNLIVNFATRGASYDWNKPEGTNSTNPDPVPGKVTVFSDILGSDEQIFADTVYIKPNEYRGPGLPGVGAPGYATAGFNDLPEFNIDSEYHNESAPVFLPDLTTLRNPNDKSASGSMFFSYIINYQAAIGSQAGAKLGIKSKDKIDLQHYHLYIDKRVTGGQIEDITNDPLLKWTVTDNEVTVDAGKYMTTNNLGYPLFLRVYVPEKSVEAINTVTLQTGPSFFANNSTFQFIGADSSTPYFRGGPVTIYDTETFDAKKGLMAFEGTSSLTDKIIVTDYAGYPENGQNPQAGSYQIKYAVTGSDNKKTNYSRIITVKHNQAEINTKDVTVVAGPNSTWKAADNFVSAKDEDGQPLSLDKITVSGNVDPQQIASYMLTYSYAGRPGQKEISKNAYVNVVASKAALKVHDKSIQQGQPWSPKDNFDGGTDAEGKAINFEDSNIQVSGTVDNNSIGSYPVVYSYKDTAGNVVTAKATVTVTKRADPEPTEPDRVSNVIVQYQDNQGNKIATDDVLSGKIGENYVTAAKEIAGYTFKEVKGNQQGTFAKDTTYVQYIYVKNASENSNIEKSSKPEANKHKQSQTSSNEKIPRNKKTAPKEKVAKSIVTNPKDPQKIGRKTNLKHKELPQTGRSSNSIKNTFLLGLSLLVLSIAGFFGRLKKKKNNKN